MGWIGVDFDGTLATYDGWRSAAHVGEPIPLMVQKVKDWLEAGYHVKIFTARISHDGTPARQRDAAHALLAIQDWCLKHIGQILPVTNEKDYGMIVLYDDRCRQVQDNTGIVIGGDYKLRPPQR